MCKKNQIYLDQFVKNCEVKQLSERRINDIKQRLGIIFREFIDKDIKKFSKEDIDDLKLKLQKRYLSYWSLSSMIATIKVFMRFLYELESSESLPKAYRDFKVSQKKYKQALYKTCDDIITPFEGFKLVKNARTKKDSAIFMLLLDAGLRPQEILKAKVTNLEKASNNYYYFLVPGDTKTGTRRVRLNFSIPFIDDWLKQCSRDKQESLFGVSYRRLYKVVNYITEGKLAPYDLRHSSISFY